MSPLFPEASGPWWVSLDDGELVVGGPALVLDDRYGSADGTCEGLRAEFVGDPRHRSFSLGKGDGPGAVAMIYHLGVGASGATSVRIGEHRVTWLGKAEPPPGSPADGDRVA